MLRWLIVLLLVANGLFLAWQQGWLGGMPPSLRDREPERVLRQVNPTAVKLLPSAAANAAVAAAGSAAASGTAASGGQGDAPPSATTSATTSAAPAADAASSPMPAADAAPAAALPAPTAPPAPAASGAASAASVPLAALGAAAPATLVAGGASTLANVSSQSATHCLESGPFPASGLAAAERALRAADLPEGSWVASSRQRKGAYLIYMGRYEDAEALARKQAELQRLKVASKPMTDWPSLQPGLVLGRYDDKPAADRALASLGKRGVRTGRVVMLTPAQTLATLRVPDASEMQRERLVRLKPAPGANGFAPCASEAAKV